MAACLVYRVCASTQIVSQLNVSGFIWFVSSPLLCLLIPVLCAWQLHRCLVFGLSRDFWGFLLQLLLLACTYTMCTHTHTHICTYTHTHAHSYTHAHMHVGTLAHTHLPTQTHTHTHTHTNTHTHTHKHLSTQTTYACMFTHTHTHTHTHIHTHRCTHELSLTH